MAIEKLLEAIEIRAIEDRDTAGMDKLLNDPYVAEWLGGARSVKAVADAVSSGIEAWAEFGYGTLVAVDNTSNLLVGRAGVRPDLLNGVEEFELFYAVLPEFFGRNIATVLSYRALKGFFSASQNPSVISYTLPANKGSIRVMEKLGFVYEQNFVHANLDHVCFRLQRADLILPSDCDACYL